MAPPTGREQMRMFTALSLAALTACGTSLQDDPSDPGAVDDPAQIEDPTPDPVDPSDPVTQQGQQALDKALGSIGWGGPGMMEQVDRAGTVLVQFGEPPAPARPGNGGNNGNGGGSTVEFDGVALQFHTSFEGEDFGDTTLFAWTGLDEDAGTVEELLLVGVPELLDEGEVDLTEPNVHGDFIYGDGAIAIYVDMVNEVTYFSDSGTFAIDSLSMDDEGEECEDEKFPPKLGDCEIIEGDAEGTVDMSGTEWEGTDTVDLEADYDVPVFRLSITENLGG